MKLHSHTVPFLCCILLSIIPVLCIAQRDTPYDSSYFERYPNKLTARFYFTKKYSDMLMPAIGTVQDLNYRANTKLGMGAGITYHNFSLNFAYGFGFLNTNISDRGKTKSLDLQAHLYRDKWAIDGLALFYKGYYLFPQDYARINSKEYYHRPDVKFDMLGLSVYALPNTNRFSYRAAMIQNEWQKKSAGSLLYGGEAYYIIMNGDSALIPKQVESSFEQREVNKINLLSFGPGAGYAYTLVIAKHFFVMGSFVGHINANFSQETTTETKENNISISPAAVYKGAIGYNSRAWNVSANFVGNTILFKGASSASYNISTGNYRMIISKKIDLKNKKLF